MVTRRGFIIRTLTASAAAALPVGNIAQAIAAESEPEPISIAPGVDVLDMPAHWNAVERYGPDDPRSLPTPPSAWEASAIVLAYEEDGRASQRKLYLRGHTDGSVRIAICAPDCFEHLRVGRGLTAIYLDPELGAEVWKGLFATSDADAVPTAALPIPRPWSDEDYGRGQGRINRMAYYTARDRALEGPDPGVYNWHKGEPRDAA